MRGVEAKVVGLSAVLKSLGSASVALQGPLGGVAGRLQGLSALSSQATSGLGAVGVGMAVATAATIGLGVALFGLVKQSAEAGGELFDLSQKTAFTVETLSGLSIVAKTTGSDIQSISGSLIIFQKNMEAAGDASSKQGKLFKSLSIDTRDNEKALRQVFTALHKMGEGAHQTAVATQFFGRSGAAVNAIIKETNGNLDEAIQKYDKMGLIISTSAATASDKFNDVLEETTLQLTAVTRSIGMELLPVATEALQSISFWLQENKGQWSSWGSTISDILRGVNSIAQSEVGSIIGTLARLGFELSGLASGFRILGNLGAQARAAGAPEQARQDAISGNESVLAKIQRLQGLQNAPRIGGGGGGGGRGGGGGSPRQDPGVQLLKQLEEQFRNLTPRTELQRVQDKLLDDQYKKTTDTLKKKIQITAMDIDAQKKILELTRERFATEASYAKFAEEEFIKSLVRTARRMSDIQRERFATKEGRERPSWIDLGDGSTVGGPIAESTRPRIATVDEQVARDRIAKIREQMTGLAGDLTSIFSSSISAGFNDGIKSGLQTLAQGLLQIVQQVFLKRLAEGLSQLLGDLATGSGGKGGFLGGLLNAVVGGILGGAAGGGGGGGAKHGLAGLGHVYAGGFAQGGVVPGVDRGYDSMLAAVRPGEVILTREQQAGMGQGQTVHNHYNTINLPPAGNTSVSAKRSARQLAEMYLGAVQQGAS